jgi:hypothetical protein
LGAGAGGYVEGRSRRTGLWVKKLEDLLREEQEDMPWGSWRASLGVEEASMLWEGGNFT